MNLKLVKDAEKGHLLEDLGFVISNLIKSTKEVVDTWNTGKA